MKHLKKLSLALTLGLILAGTGFAGEVSTPPCSPPDPGEVSTPPCVVSPESEDPTDSTLSSAQSAPDNQDLVGDALVSAIESMLTVF
jgi:hypothetical protein